MATAVEQRVRDLVHPMAETRGLTVFDVEHGGGVLRVFLDRDGGVDLDVLAEITRELSRALDEVDPISGRYTLEVSSPGLERALRTPEHFRWAVGREVTVRRVAGVEGARRLVGTVTAADDDALTLLDDTGTEHAIPYHEVDRARTTFTWGGQPKPGSTRTNPPRRAADTPKAGG